MEFYTESQRQVQAKFDSRPLADRLTETIITDQVEDFHQGFIESRDFFFLSTVNGRSEPTVSYKGGAPGLVSVLDPKTVVFPNYDGNGMFLSMGNIAETAKIGLLFIDFETPNRIRMQASAQLVDDDPEMDRYPGALQLVRAHVDSVYLNCARLIHKHTRVEASPYVPNADGSTAYPSWKRIDFVQDVLRPEDRGRAEDEGGLITMEEYGEKLAAGES